MEFGIEKCAIEIMKIRKRATTKEKKTIKSGKHQNTSREEKLLELGNIGSRQHLRRTRKPLKTKLYYRNLIKGINIWSSHLLTLLVIVTIRLSTPSKHTLRFFVAVRFCAKI